MEGFTIEVQQWLDAHSSPLVREVLGVATITALLVADIGALCSPEAMSALDALADSLWGPAAD